MNLLASTQFGTPASLEFAGWLACLVCFIAGANQVKTFLGHFRSQPPTTELQQNADFLGQRVGRVENDLGEFTRKESGNRREIYERMRIDSEHLSTKLEDTRIELKSDLKDGLSGVHKRVDDILAAVSELRGEVKRMGHD